MMLHVSSPCALCGEEPDLEPGGMSLVPKAWVHTTCAQGFDGTVEDIARRLPCCDARRHLTMLSGLIAHKWTGVPAGELWIANERTKKMERYKIGENGLERLPDLPKKEEPPLGG